MGTILGMIIGFVIGFFFCKYRNTKLIKSLMGQLEEMASKLSDAIVHASMQSEEIDGLKTMLASPAKAEKSEVEQLTSSILDHVPVFMEPKMVVIKIYSDEDGHYRWQVKAKNRKVIADSGEGYTSMQNLEKALNIVRDSLVTGSFKVVIEK